MTTHLKIDFVSDVSCPWCVIGLRALDEALERVKNEVQAELHFQPFELNPGMPAEGHYAEERFDPLWAAFAERRMPVSFHILTGAMGGDPTSRAPAPRADAARHACEYADR